MQRQPLNEAHLRRCRQCAAILIEPLRARARELGYAIGTHGSMSFDIDLIAIPWTREAVDPVDLAEALRLKAEEICGAAINHDKCGAANPAYFDQGSPNCKPHGRRVWAFQVGAGAYIDLSVMPRLGGDGYEPTSLVEGDRHG